MTKVFVAGATGWTGSAVSQAVHRHPDLTLSGGLSRSQAGGDLAEILGWDTGHVPLFGSIEEALQGAEFDIWVDFTHPEIAKAHTLTALRNDKKVILGTSGLSDADYTEIENAALVYKGSVLAAGNFAITAVLLQRFATMAARYISHYEVIDYASDRKADAPSGSVAELVYRLGQVRPPSVTVPTHEVIGSRETRGASLNGVPVHSVRLPGHVLGIEAIFGLTDERLSIRHDAGSSAEPYVQGVLLAIEKAGSFTGLRRGLDTLLDI